MQISTPWLTAVLAAIILSGIGLYVPSSVVTSQAHAQYDMPDLPDVEGHWAESEIRLLNQKEVINGYPDGYFRPEGRVKRDEFAAIIVKALELKARQVPASGSFRDVEPKHWAFRDIEAARANGLVVGSPKGYYYPDKPITRLDVLVMLAKAKRLRLPSDQSAAQILEPFIDSSDIPLWAKRYVAAAIQQDIFANYPNTRLIEPKLSASRAEVAAMIKRALYPELKSYPTDGLSTEDIQSAPAQATAGTEFIAELTSSISTEGSRLGDKIDFTLKQPIFGTDQSELFPAGSTLHGEIIHILPAGARGKNAQLGIRLYAIEEVRGKTYALNAQPASDDHLIRGGSEETLATTEPSPADTLESTVTNQPGAIVTKAPSESDAITNEKETPGWKDYGEPVMLSKGEGIRFRLIDPLLHAHPVKNTH